MHGPPNVKYQTFLGLHVMRPIYLFDLKQNWIFILYFNTIFAYKVHKAPSKWSRAIPRGPTNGQT